MVSVKTSNFTLVSFKAAYHANPATEGNFAGSSSYMLIHIFVKLSSTSANNNVSIFELWNLNFVL